MGRMSDLDIQMKEAYMIGRPARYYTNRVLELMDEGVLDPKDLAESLLQWLSEDDVRKMVVAYGINEMLDDDEQEELDR